MMLVMASLALGACSDMDGSAGWFSRRFDIAGRSAGYSFSELSETKNREKPITPNDLVNANGSCPAPAAAAPPAPPPPAAAAVTPPGAPGSPPGAGAPGDSTLVSDGGIALGMSECDVVFHAGQPSSVQIGSTPGGVRTAVLTFQGGPRPGLYRFQGGALIEMDAVAAPAPPPQVAKKKPAKAKKSAQN